MVYDCFQFFNELDILKLRLHVMAPVVDRFVISEATETFSGQPKPLYYEENKEMFSEFADKIIHVVVDDTPPGYTHDRDTFQKNAVGRGLAGCTDEDIILFSDLDEIPNPEKVKEILEHFDPTKIYHFAQRMFYCYLNMEEVSGNLLSYAGEQIAGDLLHVQIAVKHGGGLRQSALLCGGVSRCGEKAVDRLQNVQLPAAAGARP